ncbi:MAG: hypothetical protein AAGG75_08855 [Bacteroidota bacterium]
MKKENTDTWVIYRKGQVYLVNAATFERDIKQVLDGRYAKWRVKRLLREGTPEDALKYLLETNRIQNYKNGVVAAELEEEIIRPITPPRIIAPFLFLIPGEYREEYIGDLLEMLEELQQTGTSWLELQIITVIEFFGLVFNIKKESFVEWSGSLHSKSSQSLMEFKMAISRRTVLFIDALLELLFIVFRFLLMVAVVLLILYALSLLGSIICPTDEIPAFLITPPYK